jgi:hypothetical protein
MKLTQDTVNGSTIFIPFTELGTTTVDMDKKFTAKMKKGKKRTIEISRSDFRDAADAMATDFLTDEAMAWAAKRVAEELDELPQRKIADDSDFDEAFWKEYERFLRLAYEVPYYEDAKMTDFNLDDRVFVRGVLGATYGTIVDTPDDDDEYGSLQVKTDDGQIIKADIWETVIKY